jgi:hypothetical protein
MWEAVLGEKATRPEAFISKLYEANDGRLAYLFDTIGKLDPPRRAFALGLWITNATLRLERFKTLASSGIGAYRDWHLRTLPFNRGSYDLAMTLMRLSVEADGAPRQPAARGFWSRVFAGNDLPDDPARQLRGVDEEPFDAAWLTETVGSGDIRQRADRLDQIAFAQRVFSGTVDRNEVFIATRAVARYRMLMLGFERIGITTPSLYVAAARQAARLGMLDAQRAFVAEAQFQGVLAVIARMAEVRTIDVPAAQRLIERVVALPLTEDGRYNGAVAHWIREEVPRTVGPRGHVGSNADRGVVGSAVCHRGRDPADVGRPNLQTRSRRRRTHPARARPREAGRPADRCRHRRGLHRAGPGRRQSVARRHAGGARADQRDCEGDARPRAAGRRGQRPARSRRGARGARHPAQGRRRVVESGA